MKANPPKSFEDAAVLGDLPDFSNYPSRQLFRNEKKEEGNIHSICSAPAYQFGLFVDSTADVWCTACNVFVQTSRIICCKELLFSTMSSFRDIAAM